MPEMCRSCHAEIDWAYMDPGYVKPGEEHLKGNRPKANPVNHDSVDDPDGNLAVWRDGDGVLRYRYLRNGDVPAPGEHRGISHFATCPESARWRRPRQTQ
jgi:hypothetical protein